MSKTNNRDKRSYTSELQDDGYEKTGLYRCCFSHVKKYRQQLQIQLSSETCEEWNQPNVIDVDRDSQINFFSPKLFLSLLAGVPAKRHTKKRYDCLKPYCAVNYRNDYVGQYSLPSTTSTFFLSAESSDIRSAQYIGNFHCSIQKLAKSLDRCDSLAAKDYAEEMVANYQELSTMVVFNPENRLLSSTAFRSQCEFLNLLLCPRELPSFELPPKKGSPNHDCLYGNLTFYFYDLLDPYVCSSLLYLTEEFSRVEKQFYERDTDSQKGPLPFLVQDLRLALFIRRAEKEFKRYMFLNHQTYKAHLNRLLNSIVAVPYLQASSLETVKPIRLFEKIQQYVIKRIEDNVQANATEKSIKIQICIIGYSEPSLVKSERNEGIRYEERELFDLAYAVANWLEEELELSKNSCLKKVSLDVSIENLYNMFDAPRVFIQNDQIDRKVEISVGNGHHKVTAMATAISYDRFNFNTTFFTDTIMGYNDLIFLLDCPFLTEEDYDMQRGSSLNEYCESLRRWDHFDISNYPKLDKKQRTPMQTLNSQYNRIMASPTRNAGNICRVFREYWVTDIKKKLEKYSADDSPRKVVYIFTSENEGLAYSSLMYHPVSRTEQYEDKTFNIFRLSNKKVTMLPPEPKDEPMNEDGTRKKDKVMRIRISLWRMLKYASVDYAFNNFRKALEKQLFPPEGKEFADPLDIYALYQHIWVELSEKTAYSNEHRYQLSVTVKADQDAVKRILKRNGVTSDDQIKNLCDFVNYFVSTIYQTIYFPPHITEGKFGDEILRDAFSMNLYGASDDVWSLWFWHHYRKALSKGTYTCFDVSYCMNGNFINNSENHDRLMSASDFFKDKKLYDFVFRSLESSSAINPAIKALLNNVPEYYEIFGNHGYEIILGNILKMYDDLVGEDTEFRENCRIALKNML